MTGLERRTVRAALCSLLLAAAASGQESAPLVTFLKADAGGASDAYLAIQLGDGRIQFVDRLSRDPLNLRSRLLEESLFTVVGRPAGQAARPGEIFFAPIAGSDGSVRAALYVETPIGYAAYFEDPARGPQLGEIRTLTGRPFADVAAPDANFALLVRRDSSGRTEGAYLYHATTGKTLYLDGLRRLEVSPQVRPVAGLPALAGPVAAVELRAGSEGTFSYMVLDPASGEIHFFDVDAGIATQVRARKGPLSLYDVFAREGSHTSRRRFLPVAIDESRSRTLHVLIADAVTGELAVYANAVAAEVDPALAKAASLGRWFRGEAGERELAAVPRVNSSGTTLGVWLLDSQTRGAVYVDRPGQPQEMTVSPVTVERR
jgi:hypothetical protein